ncbi:MAG: tetratricopeptide repeat protein [Phototrophicaceae bacterium]
MRLFVCSDESDQDLLDLLTDLLHGYRLTIDLDRMVGYQDARTVLQIAIQECDAFVYLLTHESVNNKRCQWEFTQAVGANRPIVLVLMEECNLPPALKPHLLVDLLTPVGEERLLDVLYAVGATPPTFQRRIIRNRFFLLGVLLLGLAAGWGIAGPFSPFQQQIQTTLRGLISNEADDVPIESTRTTLPLTMPEVVATQQTLANQYFLDAQERYRTGDYRGALERYDQILALIGGNSTVHLARAEAFWALGNVDTAWGEYTQAIQLEPQSAEPYLERAQFYLAIGQVEGAMTDLASAKTLQPNDPRAYELEGELYHRQGDYQRAVETLTQALVFEPDRATTYALRGDSYRALAELNPAIADYNAAIALQPTLASAYSGRGLVKQLLGNTDSALEDFTRAVELNPNDTQALAERGRFYLFIGANASAIQDLSAALKSDPQRTTFYLWRGSAYRCDDQYALAIADFTQGAEFALDQTLDYLSTATAYSCAGGGTQEVNVERISANDPKLEAVYLFLAELLNRRAQSQSDPALAIADYLLAIRFSPAYMDVANLYAAVAQQYETLGDSQQALAYYEQARAIALEDPSLHAAVARLQAQLGDIESAATTYQRALALEGVEAEVWLQAGEFYEQTAQYDLALNAYRQAGYLTSNAPDVLVKRSRLLLTHLGDCAGAQIDLQQLQATAPNHPELPALLALAQSVGC